MQTQDRQNQVRQKLNNIRQQQKPNIKQMISFKKKAGRYQPTIRGKDLDMTKLNA